MTDGNNCHFPSRADGEYTLWGLPLGEYHVRASDDEGGFARQWFDNQPSEMTATTVIVASPGVIFPDNIDFSLALGGSISGFVTEEGGFPLQGFDVDAHLIDPVTGDDIAWFGERTNVDGEYTIVGLPAGDYRVEARPQEGDFHAHEFYDNQMERDLADLVPVASGADVIDIDFELALGGAISGIVIDQATGLPLQGASVDAHMVEPDGRHVNWGGSERTNVDGLYTIWGLPLGDYQVRGHFRDGGFAEEWYLNQPGNMAATTVTVAAPSVVVLGIDFSLAPGGSISGVVTGDDTGLPLQGFHVGAHLIDPVTGDDIAWFGRETNALGEYTREE